MIPVEVEGVELSTMTEGEKLNVRCVEAQKMSRLVLREAQMVRIALFGDRFGDQGPGHIDEGLGLVGDSANAVSRINVHLDVALQVLRETLAQIEKKAE